MIITTKLNTKHMRSIAYNGILLYAGQEIELLNLKICTNEQQ